MTEESPRIPAAPEASPADSWVEPEIESPALFSCPHCSELVMLDPNTGGPFIACPSCGGQFSIASSDAIDVEYESCEADHRSQNDELDGMRIRQVSTLRRAAIRGRTYLQIGGIVCFTGGVQLSLKAVQRVRYERLWDARTFAFIAFSIVCLMLAVFFYKRAVEIGRELKKPMLDEPEIPPDFSTLSDGTQHARDLEEMR